MSPESFEPLLLEARHPSPMTGRGNNTYLIIGSDETAVLIDAGMGQPDHVAAVEAALADRGARLTHVVVTHAHADHAEGVETIAARHSGAMFLKYPWPAEDGRYNVKWSSVDEGDVIGAGREPLTVLRTPGHSPDHIALWHEPSRSLFTGDLVIAGSSVAIDASRGGNLADYLASLKRLLALDPTRLYPAHGPRIDDPRALFSAYIGHRRDRERQVLAALAAGRATVQEIAESIYDDLGPELMAAARETVRAHLEKLRAEGRATSDRDCWTTTVRKR